MTRQELVRQVPTRRIKSYDGMAVTAEIWEEAHEYHRQQQRLHALLGHGVGIVTGLEVIASDPPDTSLNILPGVAIDPAGYTIVVPEAVAYDLGSEMKGTLYLLLGYGESRSRADRDDEESGKRYAYAEFSISAHTVLPAMPWVELARVTRRDRSDHFRNAQCPVEPGPNEIDLRFRRELGAPGEVSMAVCYLGEAADKSRREAGLKHGLGASYLAHALNRLERYHVFVDEDAPFAPETESHTLVYMVGQGRFEVNPSQISTLSNYVKLGQGMLLIEGADPAAGESFRALLSEMGVKPAALPPGHRLLVEPYLFAAPPQGYDPQTESEVLVDDGVIFSTCNYGLLWQGETRGGRASREQIRSAVEWGGNIIAYARDRRHA